MSGEWFAMGLFRNDTNGGSNTQKNKKVENADLNILKKGYKEMADINLSISKLCFEVEREVEFYYDYIAESE
jgi:CopG family transcriptional regulator/antitoxin EndoAI